MVLKWMVETARDSHRALALAAAILPILILILVRGSIRRVAPVTIAKAEGSAAVLRLLSEPDRVRIANLAASGNAIGAIRALRKLVNTDLRTAKDAVDKLATPTDD